MPYAIPSLLSCLFLALGACGFLYQENRELTKQLEIEVANKIQLSEALERQNREIEKMKIEKTNIQQEYKNIHIKYDAFKIGQPQLMEQAEKEAAANNISMNEAILIQEKKQIQAALAVFFTKKVE